MDCVGQISGLVDTMENLHNSRTKLLDRYIQAVRVDIDLKDVFTGQTDTTSTASVLAECAPTVGRLLGGMQRDLALLAQLRTLLQSLHQTQGMVDIVSPPPRGDHPSQLRGA